jgi:hypothetical protein
MGEASRQPAATAKIVASARSTPPAASPPGAGTARRTHHSDTTTTATVTSQPSQPGRPRRTTNPGSEALASTSGAGVWVASRSHSSALDGPAASTPARLAPAAEPSPVHSAARRPGARHCASGISSSGASDGFSATTTPSSAAASRPRPRRCANHASASPNSSSP